MMKSVFVMWQDLAGTRMWHPVAKLTQESEHSYIFTYTKGANHQSFSSFPNMEDKDKAYTSDQLFTFFKNRLMPESRPEHDSMFEWSGLTASSKNYIELLAISGGEKKTDHFRIVNIPKNQDGYYRVKFFVSSINYLNEEEKKHLNTLKEDESLDFLFDATNSVDCNATILLQDCEKKIGYLPHYLCKDLKSLLVLNSRESISIRVVKLNWDAPAQYRVLCELVAPWAENFKPFNDLEFENF